MSVLTDKMDKLIIRKGVSKTEFYKAVEISSATYSQWRSGQFKPRINKLQQIADYFGVSVASLLADAPETEKAVALRGGGMTDAHIQLMQEIPNLSPAECRFLLQKAKDLIEFRIPPSPPQKNPEATTVSGFSFGIATIFI